MRSLVARAGLAVVLLLAAFEPSARSSPSPNAVAFDSPGAVPPATAPSAGCDASRPAIAYYPGGAAIAGANGGPTPCITLTGFRSQEATIGVTRSGTIFQSPAALPSSVCCVYTAAGLARSTDRGATWDLVPADPQPGHAKLSDLQNCFCDPELFVDPVTDRVFWFSGDLLYCGGNLNFSDDEGRSWKRTTQFGCPFAQDYIDVFTGPPVSSTTTGYPNIVYMCAKAPIIAFGPSLACVKSLDGGATALPVKANLGTGILPPPALPQCSSLPVTGAHQAASDQHGTIYLAVVICGRPGVATSHDEGTTWRYSLADAAATPGQRAATGALAFPGISAGQMAEVGMAVDGNGVVYVGWIDGSRRVEVAASTDSGRSWGPPVALSPRTIGAEASLALAARGQGHLAAAYWGSGTAGGPVSGYISETFNVRAARPLIWSAPVNDPRRPLCSDSSCSKRALNLGNRIDYLGVTFAPDGTPWASLVADCAYVGNCDRVGPLDASTVVGVAASLRVVTRQR